MAVVLRRWWPSRSATSLKLAPLLINRLAAVWRSIWAPLSRPSRILGAPQDTLDHARDRGVEITEAAGAGLLTPMNKPRPKPEGRSS